MTRELVEYMHDCVLELAGGARGLRDSDLLESALARPMNLYAFGETSLFELAACYAEAIARNHAFVDGNKRTAFFVASDFLDQNGYELQAAVDQEHADMMVELAQGKMTRADAAAHLRTYSIKTSAT
ncbi:type II toxin-antitoxin system death-on-curing family toxin [Sulfitobacter pontiacus]|uniref:type II toxin-antitoxin system death-on-curing family toxin n=1 Tax=Sulfitobacter pontiacus TaxID=60137 RepID=UPI0030EBA293